MKTYYSLDKYLRETYGRKLYKLALRGTGTCPNRDGTVGVGGCIFCSESGSGDFAAHGDSVEQQIENAEKAIAHKIKSDDTGEQKYIAYFQSYTNTYASVECLEKLFLPAINHPHTAVLSIATRPDCLPEDVLDLLGRLNDIKPVWVELGLQSTKEETARLINRGYSLPCFERAVAALRDRGIKVIAHVILGLPGETREDMLDTIRCLNEQRVDGVKLQLLHVLRGTQLEKTDYVPMTLEEYTETLISCIEHLSPEIVVHRITGDGDKKILVAPLWSANKRSVLNTIHKRMSESGAYQGRLFHG